MTLRSRTCAAALCVVLLMTVVHAAGPDPDLVQLQHYTLTTDTLKRFTETYADLEKLAKSNPQWAKSMESESDNHESLADMEKRLSVHPEIAGIIKQHGFSMHEFVVAQMSIIQAAFALMAKKSGADPAKLATEAHVNPQNITFLEQHKDEFEQLQKQLGSSATNDEQ